VLLRAIVSLVCAIARRLDAGAREPPAPLGFTRRKRRNFGLGIRQAEERELGQEVVVRLEAGRGTLPWVSQAKRML
jgi:hypothetical protein